MKAIFKCCLFIILFLSFLSLPLHATGEATEETTKEVEKKILISVKLCNLTDRIMIYNLYLTTYKELPLPKPMAVAGGELQPGKDSTIEKHLAPGTYFVHWFPRSGSQITDDAFYIRYHFIVVGNEALITLLCTSVVQRSLSL